MSHDFTQYVMGNTAFQNEIIARDPRSTAKYTTQYKDATKHAESR